MKRYHGQAPTHTFPHCVKTGPADDVRDHWRCRVAADAALGAGALRVALALLNFVNRSGSTSVGIARLAAEIGRHRRNIERGLRQLVAAGYIEREAGGGRRGNGGLTCGTRLKVPAAAAPSAAKVPATVGQGTGDGGPKVPATVAGETLLTHRTRAAPDAPGLEAGSANAENSAAGSNVGGGAAPSVAVLPIGPPAVRNGEVLELLGELATSARADARPARDAALESIWRKLGQPAKRAASGYENSATADECGGSEPVVL